MQPKKKVLLVDDDADILTLLKQQLEKEGRQVVVTRHPSMVLRLIKEESPDLIVCDIMMDERSGGQVALDLSKTETGRNVPFVFLSSKIDEADIDPDGTINGVQMMSKSSPRSVILARIAHLLGEA